MSFSVASACFLDCAGPVDERVLLHRKFALEISIMLGLSRGRLAHIPRVVRTRALASISATSSINPTSADPFQVFDRNVKRMQKDRSAEREEGARSRTVDYVRDEVADRLIERMQVRRTFCHP